MLCLSHSCTNRVSKVRNWSLWSYLDSYLFLFLLAFVCLAPHLSFSEVGKGNALVIATYVILIIWLLSHVFHKKSRRYSDAMRACCALVSYVLFFLFYNRIWNIGNGRPLDPNDPQDSLAYFLKGALERTIVFAFSHTKTGTILSIAVLPIRYFFWRPTGNSLIIMVISDVILVLFHLRFRMAHTRSEKALRKLQKEIFFLKHSFLPNVMTPTVMLSAKTLKPVFQSHKLQEMLENLSIKLPDFFKRLVLNFEKDSPSYGSTTLNLGNFSECIPQIKHELQHNAAGPAGSNKIECTGTIQLEESHKYFLQARRGLFENQEVIWIQIHNLSLNEKIKTLEEGITYKEHVLDTVAHDIRNPLGAMVSLLDILEKRVEDQDDADSLKTCKIAADYLFNILNTYLDGSQIKKKKLQLVPREIHTKSYFDELSRIFGLMCRQKLLNFCIKVKPRTPRAFISDSNRLTQILTNLVSNAIKFTKAGGSIILHVSSSRTPESPNPIINFSVEDSGIGISHQDQQKLFKAFSRCDTTAQINPYGVGLGLLICNDLVSLLDPEEKNARILVRSEVGKGSIFSFGISSALNVPHSIAAAGDMRGGEGSPSIVLDVLQNSSHDEESILTNEDINHDTIGGKMMDYSRNYGRLNGSKFHTPSHQNIPNSFSVLFDISSTDMATRAPVFSGVQIHGYGRAMSFVKSTFGDQTTKNFLPTPKSERGFPQDPFINYLRPSSTFTPKKGASIDRLSSPTSRASRFKPGRTFDKYILVVDDELFNLKVVRHLLNEKGYEAVFAANGQECIESVKFKAKDSNFYQAILLDCHMPVMDGYEACRELRRLMEAGEIPTVPIVALTGVENEESIAKCKEAGMTEIFEKPLNEEKINVLLHDVFMRGASDHAPDISRQESTQKLILDLRS